MQISARKLAKGGEGMGLFNWFGSKKEDRSNTADPEETLEDILLSVGMINKPITKEQALNIPAVSACVTIIAECIAGLPVYLYKEDGKSVKKISDDPRIKLLNDETGDTLDAFEFKKALIVDYLLTGGGYAFINRERNRVKSLHHVDASYVATQQNSDPIFKDYRLLVNGAFYEGYQFIKMLRNTKDGITGTGIIHENNKLLSVVYNSLIYEELLLKTGGNKKGFLKSQGRLSDNAMKELKEAWRKLYSNNTENVVILNNGLDFQEASSSSVELQLNENKKTNSEEICKLFIVPPSILDGTATEDVTTNWIKTCILPKLISLQTALNKSLLLPSEKGSFYFAFDTKELLKGDIEKRFKAYEIGTKNGILQIDEVRYLEDLEPLGLDFIKLGLQDVLYDPVTKKIYTPNTDKTATMDNSNADSKEDSNNETNSDVPTKGGETE